MQTHHNPSLSLSIGVAYLFSALLIVVLVTLGITHPMVSLSENQALYIFSSESQVVAAVYGLTLTGYVFLRNQQDRLVDKDDSLTEIFDRIQRQQYGLVAFITIASFVSIASSLIAIVSRESPSETLKAITFNSAASLFFISIFWTGYFVLDALHPGKISSASRDIKREEEIGAEKDKEPGASKSGNLEEFLTNFNAISVLLDTFAAEYLDRSDDSFTIPGTNTEIPVPKTNWSKPAIIRALVAQEIIFEFFGRELLSLSRYRNAIVHGNDMNVTTDSVVRVKQAHQLLAERLRAYQVRRRGVVTTAAGPETAV